jgi:prepilin-type N-terminal cleavage/methylation domain-containing protein
MPCRRKPSGFTLIELIVAVFILTVMALMLTRIFFDSSRAVEQGKDQALMDETARLILDVLENDISQALVRPDVPFRIHAVDGQDALYFISTAARRQLEGIPRDTAPIRWQATQESDWNHYLQMVSPDSSSGHNANTRENLIHHSDQYFTEPDQTADDFFGVNTEDEGYTNEREYSQYLESGIGAYAVLSFIQFDPQGAQGPVAETDNGQPDENNLPRYVDITLGLIPSMELERALSFKAVGDTVRAEEYINNRERVYTRRVHLPNRGISELDL